MNTKKVFSVLLVLLFMLVFISCDTEKDNESGSTISEKDVSVSQISSDDSEKSESESEQKEEASKEPSEKEQTEYLSVIDCTLSDKNCFVIVGKCEEGAVVTAQTDTQNVTSDSDSGFYSVRLKKESPNTQVTLTAKGNITEEITYDACPKVPTSDMWPIVSGNGYNFFFQKMMPDFMQTNTLSGGQIDSLTSRIKSRIDELKQVSPNTEIIYMVVPSKASIYPDLVPEEYAKGTGKSRLEQVNEALEAGGATVINLLEIFKEHKDDELKLYWKTDSHWTDYGAYVAYTELFNHISEKFPSAAPRKQDEFEFKKDFYNGGDMIYYLMMDQNVAQEYNCLRVPKFSIDRRIEGVERYKAPNYLMYNDALVPEHIFNTNHSELPDLYVMRDSYSTQMFDILAERGNTTVYKPMWGFIYNIYEIENYTPDYIIYIVSEWNLNSVIQG